MAARERIDRLRSAARVGLGLVMVVLETGHLTFLRDDFHAQVPRWVPFDADDTVLVSGAGEIAPGAALIGLPKEGRRIGVILATLVIGRR